MDRKIVFPEIKAFGDLFEQIATDKEQSPEAVTFYREDWRHTRKGNRRKGKVRVDVGPFCSIHDRGGYRHVYARPVPAVRDYLAANWIGDSPGSFQVTVRDDGTALVTAEYSRIIGSHWLALVDASTVQAESPLRPAYVVTALARTVGAIGRFYGHSFSVTIPEGQPDTPESALAQFWIDRGNAGDWEINAIMSVTREASAE